MGHRIELGHRFTIAALALLPAMLVGQGLPAGYAYEPVVTSGLQGACSMAFAPDGRLFVCERLTGEVRVLRDGTLDPQVWYQIPYTQAPITESGLLGIAIDPQFLSNGFVYLFYTDPSGLENRIARVRDANGVGIQFTVLSPNGVLPTHPLGIHNGGRMTFGFDGKLYVSVGDAEDHFTPQNPGVWAGKILRFEAPNLTIPVDNPIPGSPAYALGIRNSYGLAVHHSEGWLFCTENGYMVGDEINHIVAGGNYGWPQFEGPTTQSGIENPLLTIAQQPALTGAAFHDSAMYPPPQGCLFFCEWLTGDVRRLTLTQTGNNVVANDAFADNVHSFDIQMGPDGNLWILHGPFGFGGTQIGRYVHANAPSPGLHIMAVSGPSLGGSFTVGVTANPGDIVVPWLGLSTFQPPVQTVFGLITASPDALLPLQIITTDNRSYYGSELPNATAFIGVPLHSQALRIDPTQMTYAVTNLATHILR